MKRVAWVVAIVLLLPFVLFGLLMLAVQSDFVERKVERMVAAKLHREVEINGISLKPGFPPLVTVAHLRISNPEWARSKDLVNADAMFARVRLLPLLKGYVVVPYLGARRATAGIEMDGEKGTWKFGPKSDEPSKLFIQMVYLDDGHIAFLDHQEKTDLKIDVNGSAGAAGELNATATGTFKGDPVKAVARIPKLDPQHESPLNVRGEATIGKTQAKAEGSFTTDASQLDLHIQIKGQSFKDLNDLTGMLLPDSPPYNIAGHLRHVKNDWIFEDFQGKVGVSDLRGGLTYSKGSKRPFLKANLKSKLLDIGDLGPMVKAPPREGSGAPKSDEQQQKAAELKVSDRMLPDEPFTTDAWTKMDADVTLDAERVQRPKQLPINAFATHLILKDGAIKLDPLNFGLADGTIKSTVLLDGTQKPMHGVLKADVQGVHLAPLFPTVKSMQDALGTMYTHVELEGRGDSIAALLGTSNGQASLAVGGGQVSSLILELVDLHVPEIVMLLGKKYEQSQLNCAVGTLNVKNGIADIDSFVIDTDTNEIRGDGHVNLKDETIHMEVKPYAKHATLISLNSPLEIKGHLKKPKGYPEPMHLAAKVGGAVALGAIAPPLALLALVDTGKGKDQDCGKYLAEAKARGAKPKSSGEQRASTDTAKPVAKDKDVVAKNPS